MLLRCFIVSIVVSWLVFSVTKSPFSLLGPACRHVRAYGRERRPRVALRINFEELFLLI